MPSYRLTDNFSVETYYCEIPSLYRLFLSLILLLLLPRLRFVAFLLPVLFRYHILFIYLFFFPYLTSLLTTTQQACIISSSHARSITGIGGEFLSSFHSMGGSRPSEHWKTRNIHTYLSNKSQEPGERKPCVITLESRPGRVRGIRLSPLLWGSRGCAPGNRCCRCG
ncbi:hypothetical protein F5B19DRAFT_332883 [Rostrohypoxylon terebratum]|nr:hypothetical protein F5B19DRAFT_332883 [Rostrohypoxylon terebratum]